MTFCRANNSGNLKIEDWGFNGWGNQAPYTKCNVIPTSVANAIGMPKVNLNSTMKVEGGGFEVDGNGSFMATRSSILNANRNPGMTQAQAEAIFETNLGVTNFIWLDGVPGLDLISPSTLRFAYSGGGVIGRRLLCVFGDGGARRLKREIDDYRRLHAGRR